MEKIVNIFIGLFGGITGTVLGKEILVFIISLMPILELRGGLLAASLIGLDPIPSYIISVIGNILPVPFILWFMGRILKWMKTRKKLKKIANWIDKKVEKNREKIEKFIHSSNDRSINGKYNNDDTIIWTIKRNNKLVILFLYIVILCKILE